MHDTGSASPSGAEQAAARRLHSAGLRLTASRQRLLHVLIEAARPLTLPEILDADAGLSQSSAYRNLAELTDAGVVHRIVTSDEHSRFELTAEVTDHHHHHLVCDRCGRVTDVQLTEQLERLLERETEQVADTAQFSLSGHRLDLIGTCGRCARA